MKQQISHIISESIATKQAVLADSALLATVEAITKSMVGVFEADGKVLFCGNGGSAADAQHLAAELSGRFYLNRPALFAEALHVNSSYLTAVANDFSYEDIYSRMVQAAGRKGDMLIAISTSGNSGNIVKAIEVAKKQGMIVVGFTGKTGGKMREMCDFLINIPSTDTPRIQESHILIGHIICQLVEAEIFGKK